MTGRLLRLSLIPALVVGACVWGALGSDSWWATVCVGVLAALAFGFWMTIAMIRALPTEWEVLAKEATLGQSVASRHALELVSITTVALGELRKHDTEASLLIGQRLLDTTARYEELT